MLCRPSLPPPGDLLVYHNLLIILAASLVVIALFRHLSLPPLLAYMTVGLFLGQLADVKDLPRTVRSFEVNATTIVDFVRKPDSTLGCGGSQANAPNAASRSSTRACLAASCRAYGTPMAEHERHTPASK